MKYLKFICVILLSICLSGCVFDDPKYINLKAKPNIYYYSNDIYKRLKNNESFSLKVFDVKFYEYYDVGEEDSDILISFFESSNTNNYLEELDLSNEKLQYRLLINFDNSGERYAINVYNKDVITIFPWDGNFEEDIINMEGISDYNNIYDFCKYIINKAHNIQ